MENTDKLKDLATSSRSSEWMELKAYKKENRRWLDRSMDIALRIMDVLDEKGMSQSKLAEQMKVSRQHVSTILRGTENLSLETISKIEDALGVDLLEVTAQKQEAGTLFQAFEVKSMGYLDVDHLISFDYFSSPLISYCTVNDEPLSMPSILRRPNKAVKPISSSHKCLIAISAVPTKPVVTSYIAGLGYTQNADKEDNYAIGI